MSKDDSIDWFRNPKDFEGFDVRKNCKKNGYDVFGLLKGRNVWLKVGYLRIQGYDVFGYKAFFQFFMFPMVFTLPLFLRMLWFL